MLQTEHRKRLSSTLSILYEVFAWKMEFEFKSTDVCYLMRWDEVFWGFISVLSAERMRVTLVIGKYLRIIALHISLSNRKPSTTERHFQGLISILTTNQSFIFKYKDGKVITTSCSKKVMDRYISQNLPEFQIDYHLKLP